MLKIYNYLLRNKTIGFGSFFLFLSIVGFLASKIELEEDFSSLIPSEDSQNVLKRVLDQNRFSNKIIVTISSTSEEPNPEELTLYATKFIDSVKAQLPEYVENIQGKIPDEGIREIYNFIYKNIPLFLNEKDYLDIQDRLKEDKIKIRLKENYKTLISPTGLITKEFLFKDPLSITGIGINKLEELQVGNDFEIYNNYLLNRDGKNLLLFLTPNLPASETKKNQEFLSKLKAIQNNLNKEFQGVEGDFFGGVLYSVANSQQIKKDVKITMGIALVILFILLIYYYKKIYVPLLLFVPGLLGGITAIAVLYVMKGSISTISLGIGAILLGVSLDYSLHVLTYFKNNRNITKLYREVTGPILMSSSTTAIAFLCLLFIQSEALKDLGIFAAISVSVASIFALILIPLSYRTQETSSRETTFLDKIAAVEFHKKHGIVILMGLLFIGGLFMFTKVQFNNDLSSISYEPEGIKLKEKRIQKITGRGAKSVYLVTYGNTVDQALEINNELYNKLSNLEQQEQVSNFSSIGGVVLSTKTQLERIARWEEFWTKEKKGSLRENLVEKSSEFGFKPESFQEFYGLISQNFDPILLDDYQKTTNLYLDDFISSGEDFATVTTSIDLKNENLDELVGNLNEIENLVVIDSHLINKTLLGNLKNDFDLLITYSLIAVFLILLLFYGSLELTVLTIFPIILSWVIALGLMAVLQIEFNILNIIISTFIFGLGLDYSIFVTHAFLKEYETGKKVLKTYRTSILLSVLTTLLGMGALFFAEHPALRSISLVSIIGILSAVLVAFVLQGFLFDIMFLSRNKKGKPAFDFTYVFRSTKERYKKDKLYFKNAVYDNYRYKSVYPQVKREFQKDKERYFKLAGFIEEGQNVLHLFCEIGVLPVYLHYKKPETMITGFEPDADKIIIAENIFAAQSPFLNFVESLPSEIKNYDVIILSKAPDLSEMDIKTLITAKTKTIIILDPEYVYRWIVDLNFEISYRQNDVVILQKVD